MTDYRKYLPGQFTRILLKIEQNRLFWNIFNSAIMNDLTMIFTARLKMPIVLISSKTGLEWRTILGHPQLIECMGICFEPGAWI